MSRDSLDAEEVFGSEVSSGPKPIRGKFIPPFDPVKEVRKLALRAVDVDDFLGLTWVKNQNLILEKYSDMNFWFWNVSEFWFWKYQNSGFSEKFWFWKNTRILILKKFFHFRPEYLLSYVFFDYRMLLRQMLNKGKELKQVNKCDCVLMWIDKRNIYL